MSHIIETKKPVARSAKYVPIADREKFAIKQINWWQKAYEYMTEVLKSMGRARENLTVVRLSPTDLKWGGSRIWYDKGSRDIAYSDARRDSAYIDYYLVVDAVRDKKIPAHPYIKRTAMPAGYRQWLTKFQQKLGRVKERDRGKKKS